jgi:hypothetical protein
VSCTPVGFAGRPHGRFALVGEELSGLHDRRDVALLRERRLGWKAPRTRTPYDGELR